MTEAEWLACDVVSALLNFVARHSSRRKERLFAVACCWRHTELLSDESHKTLLTLERVADDPWPADAREALTNETLAYADGLSWHANTPNGCARWQAADAVYCVASLYVVNTAQEMRRAVAAATTPPEQFDVTQTEPSALIDPVENVAQIRLVREVFGNPFRPVAFSPFWRTSTAVTLARTMYDARDFSAMPILADALQDAGCDSDDILNHCRDTAQAHVRGCGVLGLMLGKE